MLKHFWHNFIIHYDLYITFDELSNFSHNLPSSFKISNCSETFQLQRIFPTSKEAFQLRSVLSNLVFPISFQNRTKLKKIYFSWKEPSEVGRFFWSWKVFSNFNRFFPTSLGSFKLPLALSNFSETFQLRTFQIKNFSTSHSFQLHISQNWRTYTRVHRTENKRVRSEQRALFFSNIANSSNCLNSANSSYYANSEQWE